MEHEVSRILGDYQAGRVTRRQVVVRLALLGALAGGGRAGTAAPDLRA
jgi:hypothetical protein